MPERFDLIIIGAGPGGYPAALMAAKAGKQVALVESREVGGTCLNRGCIPTKTLLHASRLYREMRDQLETIGLSCEKPDFDGKSVWEHKDQVVEGLRQGILQSLKKAKVTLFQGFGKITGPNEVAVTGKDGNIETLQGDYILIAVGSKPSGLKVPGMELNGVTDSDGILNGPGKVDGRFLIIGGGVIGMEMATVYSDFGCHVTVIEALDRILPGMDKEISQNLKMILKKRGVEIHTSSFVKEIKETKEGLLCCFEEKGAVQEALADRILVAAGRRPVTEGLFSEQMEALVEKNRGYLVADENGRTSLETVYAIGDVTGKIQLAHAATAQGCRAVEVMFGLPFSQNLNLIPSCVYTNPEIASVGLDAETAKKLGIQVKTSKYLMSMNGKSVLSMQERGFIKLVADAQTKQLLGAQLMCARATDLISAAQLAIAQCMTAKELVNIVLPHPTYCEGIGEAARELDSSYNET